MSEKQKIPLVKKTGKPMPAERVASEILTRFRIGEPEATRPARSARVAG